MRFWIHVLLIAILSSIAEWVWAWWMISLVSFLIIGFTRTRPAKSFLAGFTGVALSWLVWVLWQDIANEHILSGRMAKLFGLPNYPLFIVVTIVLGGLIGGLSGLTASYVRRIV